MQNKHQIFLGGSSRLGQNPKFVKGNISLAPLTYKLNPILSRLFILCRSLIKERCSSELGASNVRNLSLTILELPGGVPQCGFRLGVIADIGDIGDIAQNGKVGTHPVDADTCRLPVSLTLPLNVTTPQDGIQRGLRSIMSL